MHHSGTVFYLYSGGKNGKFLYLDTTEDLGMNPLLRLAGHSPNISELIKIIKTFENATRLHVVGKKTYTLRRD